MQKRGLTVALQKSFARHKRMRFNQNRRREELRIARAIAAESVGNSDNMNLLILTPTNRPLYWAAVKANLEAAFDPRARIFWMPLLYQTEMQSASPPELDILFGHCAPAWVRPLVIHAQPLANAVAIKLNAGLDQIERMGFDGWVLPCSDDDLLPADWVAHLWPGRDKAVLVTNCKRGQHQTPQPGYDITDLLAAPENMVVGRVTGSQAAIHASLLERLRFAHHACADGMMIQALHERMPEQFHYAPDCFVAFNALEPGRWDKGELLKVLKSKTTDEHR